MVKSLIEALRLIEEALALLDAAGELDVVPHLDLAAHRLRDRVELGESGLAYDLRALDVPGKLN